MARPRGETISANEGLLLTSWLGVEPPPTGHSELVMGAGHCGSRSYEGPDEGRCGSKYFAPDDGVGLGDQHD